MTSLLTKEEQEELLNQKIEMMKKKNAELMRRHQLVEEDKRLAEQQGRSVTIRNQQASYSPMKGEILRAAEDDGKRKATQNSRNQTSKKYNGPNVKLPVGKAENNESGPPPDPACKFLADRRREGPLPQHGRGREFSRRHPRNFGGIDFNDVPKKIHDEKEKQTYQPQIRTKADETLYTTGKERREREEWRREREKIDRERLERQKNKEGNWRREWDRDKDELSYTDELDDHDEPVNSRPPQQAPPRPDDRFKASGRVRHQRKKDGQNNDSDAATTSTNHVNNRSAHHSDSNAPRHLNDEATRHSRVKPLLPTERPLLRTTSTDPRDEEKRFRHVHEQNDSLIINIKSQPSSDFHRVPSNSPGNFPVQPDSAENASRNHPKNGRRNFRDGRPVSRLSSSSDVLWGSGRKVVPDSRRVEELGVESVPPRTYRNEADAEKANSSRNANRGEGLRETLDVKPRRCSDEGFPDSPKKLSSDSKAEKPVGSGRISIQGKKRRSKNRRKRDGAVNSGQRLDPDVHTASGASNATQNIKRTIPADVECEARTRATGAQDRVIRNPSKTKNPVFHANDQTLVYSSKNSGYEEAQQKNRSSSQLVNDKCLDDNFGAKRVPPVKSFDLDPDPLEGDDQFDDEDWEDIDEEVCIDLIAGVEEEESYEENPFDISDDTLDQLVSAHILPPRGQKVVDWAAEMESAEGNSGGVVKQATSGDVLKSHANERP